jgi:hypothetical protein
MTAMQKAENWRKQAIVREVAILALILVPIVAVSCTLLWRLAGFWPAVLPACLVFAIGLAWALRIAARHDRRWLIRQLDKNVPELEDSSDLLWRPEAALSLLQSLQNQRIIARIEQLPALDLRRSWPKARLAVLWLLALMLVAAIIFWHTSKLLPGSPVGNPLTRAEAETGPVKLLAAQLKITAPAYTGLPVVTGTALHAKFPEASRLQWQLRFQPQPTSAELVFFDGQRIPLQQQGDAWTASRVMAESDVYRIEIDSLPLPPGKWQRLDAIKDQAPVVRTLLPDRSLSLVAPGQTRWPLQFEAEDDYGLGNAEIEIQLAQGSGENIEFKSIIRTMTGQGNAASKRFAGNLDLAELGMQIGDDLIVQFRIKDRRQPTANETRSSSFILRWPSEDTVETTGVEGLLKKVMPAYFRSQRQIIIDTEKLLAQRSKLDAVTFEIRSDTIGVDQRLLRLRYGQFLGEESEGVRSAAKPEAGQESGSDGGSAEEQGHSADDGHDHGDGKSKAKTASSGNQAVLEQFGHTHDIPEAATMLDPETKALLRAALNEMWQAELHLRTAEPKKALPYEYRALALIKKVQQASRIYLARVGSELPPIDESRRLSGDRTGYVASKDGLAAATADDAPLLRFWQILSNGEGETPDYAALRQWLAKHPARVPDALGLKVALAELQSRPDCLSCRESLMAQLWPVLPKVPAVPQSRNLPEADDVYRKALQQERER